MNRVSWTLLGAALLAAPATRAQDSAGLVAATYYQCAQGDASRAASIYKEHVEPVLKAEQALGHIAAYGWAQHRFGGEWRRLEYVTGTNLDQILDYRAAVDKMMDSPGHARAMDEFNRICSSHDDYIWRSKASSQAPRAGARTRAPISMSAYYVCNAGEDEADAIVTAVFAPALNQRVQDGKIVSWSWMEHVMGGPYHRLLTVDAADEKALVNNWASLPGDLRRAAPELSRRFAEICGSAREYVWDIGAH
jgi:hypothetical protein